MATTETNILNRLYFIAGCMFVFALAVVFKLCTIQFIQGDDYRALAEERTVKNHEIPANRGNVYSADGSLLATSMTQYEIRMDAVTVDGELFEKNIRTKKDFELILKVLLTGGEGGIRTHGRY